MEIQKIIDFIPESSLELNSKSGNLHISILQDHEYPYHVSLRYNRTIALIGTGVGKNLQDAIRDSVRSIDESILEIGRIRAELLEHLAALEAHTETNSTTKKGE